MKCNVDCGKPVDMMVIDKTDSLAIAALQMVYILW